MKKIILIFLKMLILIYVIILINGKISTSNSEQYENDEQIIALMNHYSEEHQHEFKLATKEIEQVLYGKWKAGEGLGLGYSTKYDITGDALRDGKIYLSKDDLSIIYRVTALINIDGKIRAADYMEDDVTSFKSPVLMYYNETLEQMKQDDFLDNYSGIKELAPDTVGTVIVAAGLPVDYLDQYEFIGPKFIIIGDYIMAVNQSTFYKMEKID